MPVYIVAQIRIDDRETYGQYEAGFMQIFQQYQGEIVAVDDAPQIVETRDDADAPDFTRVVILRFPDTEAAQAWYRSPEYQELAKKRLAASKGVITLVNGIG